MITDENKNELLQFLVTLQSLKALIMSYDPEKLQERLDKMEEKLLSQECKYELIQIKILLMIMSIINSSNSIEILIDVIRDL